MRFLLAMLFFTLCAACASTPTATSAAGSPAADLVLTNGTVYSGDPQRPRVEAVAIRGELILATGSATEIARLVGPATRVVDLAGRLVVPGINDAHVHVPWAGEPSVGIAIPDTASAAGILELVREEAARQPDGALLAGQLPIPLIDAPPTRQQLDAVAPRHRVTLAPLGGHSALLNSAALDAWGIRDDAVDPPGGKYGRSNGRINGWLYEHAYWLPQRVISQSADDATIARSIRLFEDEVLRYGITSVQTMPLVPADRTERLVREAQSRLRWRVIELRMAPFDGSASRRPVKYIVDGTPIERSAALRHPYADDPSTSGWMNFSLSEIDRMVENAATGESQLLVHVAGDASAAAILNAMQRRAGVNWSDHRVRLEHGDGVSGELIDLARKLGVIVTQNPSHFLGEMNQARYGERVRNFMRARSILEAGVHFGIASDGPLNPYLNMMLAAMHPDSSESLGVEESLRAYTATAAYSEFEEGRKGKLVPGMLADLAVLSQNILEVPIQQLPATSSLMTIIGGEIVWEAKPD